MSTLYKRANLPQARVLKVIEGAVKNAAHAHPEGTANKNFARSVAKRAVGTLTAQWPDVLALRDIAASEDEADNYNPASSSSGGRQVPVTRRAAYLLERRRRRSQIAKTAPLAVLNDLHRDLGIFTSIAKQAGMEERVEALQDALRLIRAAINRIKT